MQTDQTEIYLLIPNDSNKRILHPGKLMESTSDRFVVEFTEVIEIAVNQDVNIFFVSGGKFFQQGARIAAIGQNEPQMVVAFTKIGSPASAECRQTYRVSVAACEIYASIGSEAKCHIIDLSPEGFAVITRGDFQIGSLVEVKMIFEGQTLSGQARVQGVRQLPNGSRRFGFLISDAHGVMRRQLGQETAAAQRAQLRRLARTA